MSGTTEERRDAGVARVRREPPPSLSVPGSPKVRAQAFLTMVRKHLTEASRYPISFIATFGMIVLILGMFTLAALAFSDPSKEAELVPLKSVALYGFVIFMFTTSTLWEMGFSLRTEQVRGTLESLYLTPASKVGNLVSRVFSLLVGTGIMVVLSIAVVKASGSLIPIGDVWLGLLILLFTITGLLGIGFMFAALTIVLKESAQLAINGAQFALLIICAMFFPFSALPAPLVDYVSRWVPLSYCVDAFRTVMSDYPAGYPELAPLGVELAVVVGFGVLTPIIGYMIYRRVERHARERGSLGEY